MLQPLIKSEGMESIRRLRREFPDKTILADMKTVDAGYLEVEMAAGAGANLVTVMAVAPDSTIASAIDAGREHGVGIVVDLMGVENLVERASQVWDMGPGYLLVHTGLDEQASGATPFSSARALSESLNARLAVAGGLNPENIQFLKGSRVDVVVVGGYIIRSPDPKGAAARIREAVAELEGYRQC